MTQPLPCIVYSSGYPGDPTRQLSFVTDSDATDDDIPGPGRIVGKALSWGGRYVERLATWAVLYTGGGPYGVIEDILEVERRIRLKHLTCDIWRRPLPLYGARVYPGRPQALSDHLHHMGTCRTCLLGSERRCSVTAARALKLHFARLLKLCGSSNISVSDTALAAVACVAVSSHFAWRMFVELHAETVLQHVVEEAHAHLGCQALSARLRTALYSVSESGVMSVVPRVEALRYEWDGSHEVMHALFHDLSMYLRSKNKDTRSHYLRIVSRYMPPDIFTGTLAAPLLLLMDSPNCPESAIAKEYLHEALCNWYDKACYSISTWERHFSFTSVTYWHSSDTFRDMMEAVLKHRTTRCSLKAAQHRHKGERHIRKDFWVSCSLRGTWRLILYCDGTPPKFFRVADIDQPLLYGELLR